MRRWISDRRPCGVVCSGAVLLPGLGVEDRTSVMGEMTDLASSLVSLGCVRAQVRESCVEVGLVHVLDGVQRCEKDQLGFIVETHAFDVWF